MTAIKVITKRNHCLQNASIVILIIIRENLKLMVQLKIVIAVIQKRDLIFQVLLIEEHNKGKFQLTGAHLAVPCKNCHQQEKEWHFKNVGLNCIDCHKNVHGTELAQKYLPENKCNSCHQTENWSTITFDHDSTEFALIRKAQKCYLRQMSLY